MRVSLDFSAFTDKVKAAHRQSAAQAYADQERDRAEGVTRVEVAKAARRVLGDDPLIDAYEKGGPAGPLMKRLSLIPVSDPGWSDAFAASRMFRKVVDVRDIKSRAEWEEEFSGIAQRFIAETEEVARGLVRLIEQAIRRARAWQGWSVGVKPMYDPDHFYEGPVRAFYVSITNQVGFTAFAERGNRVRVGDVMESEDHEFVRKPQLQMNYFDLVRELENPGSTQKPGRKLKLWTARPIRDRQTYERAKHVPANIYLTTSKQRAMGIAHELGAGEVRDVWRITIHERYLMKTLDTGVVQDYQTIGQRRVPIVSAALVFAGEDREVDIAATLNSLQEAFGPTLSDPEAPWQGSLDEWLEYLYQKLGLEESEAMAWIRQKHGAAKAQAHREFLAMVRKDPAAHRRKMSRDKAYHRKHKFHDKLMRKTARKGFRREDREVDWHSSRARGRALMDNILALPVLTDVQVDEEEPPKHYQKTCSMESFYANVKYFKEVKSAEWEGSERDKLQRAIAASYSVLKRSCGVESKERMTPSEIVKKGGGQLGSKKEDVQEATEDPMAAVNQAMSVMLHGVMVEPRSKKQRVFKGPKLMSHERTPDVKALHGALMAMLRHAKTLPTKAAINRQKKVIVDHLKSARMHAKRVERKYGAGSDELDAARNVRDLLDQARGFLMKMQPAKKKKKTESRQQVEGLGEFRPLVGKYKKQGLKIVLEDLRNQRMHLAKLIVPPEKRTEGAGTKFMTELCELADSLGVTLTTTPSRDFGASSVARLKLFYKRFGFVDNKGPNKDYEISESMYRPPQ